MPRIDAHLIGGPHHGQVFPDVLVGKSIHFPGSENLAGEYKLQSGPSAPDVCLYTWTPGPDRQPLEMPIELQSFIDGKDEEIARLGEALAALCDAANAFYDEADYNVRLDLDAALNAALFKAEQVLADGRA